jgi:hypothetical protein
VGHCKDSRMRKIADFLSTAILLLISSIIVSN